VGVLGQITELNQRKVFVDQMVRACHGSQSPNPLNIICPEELDKLRAFPLLGQSQVLGAQLRRWPDSWPVIPWPNARTCARRWRQHEAEKEKRRCE
jgi:hypothetical protein